MKNTKRYGLNRRLKPWSRRIFLGLVVLAALLIVIVLIVAVLIAPMQRQAKLFPLDKIREGAFSEKLAHEKERKLANGYAPAGDTTGDDIVMLSELPEHLVECAIAVEDSRFYEHRGIDYFGILRAARENIRAGGVRQGGVTITQQLARRSFSLKGRTFKRKLTEAFLAQRIEGKYSKDEILELYLSSIYFGEGYYGIEAAAEGYFGHPASELSLPESAILIGLIKGPSRLSPRNHPQSSLAARNQALLRMRQEEQISQEDYEKFVAQPLEVSEGP